MTPKKLSDQLKRLRERVAAGDPSAPGEVERLTEILLEMMEDITDLRVENEQLKERLRRLDDDGARRSEEGPSQPTSRLSRTIRLEPFGEDGVVFSISVDGHEATRVQRIGSKAVPVLVSIVECQLKGRVFTSSDVVSHAPDAFMASNGQRRMNSSEVSSALRSYMPTVDGWLSDPEIAVGHVEKTGRAQWTFKPFPGSVDWIVDFPHTEDNGLEVPVLEEEQ